MTQDLAAAVARLRNSEKIGQTTVDSCDIRTVLSALEAAQAGRPAPSAESPATDDLVRAESAQWKSGNEFAPYHPQASHVPPDYRDGWNACYAKSAPHIERQAREIADNVDAYAAQAERAERAEAERDALRECVRAADAMADAYYPDPFHHAPPLTVDAYNAARAKVNTTEGEK